MPHDHKTHSSWFCEVPEGMTRQEAEARLELIDLPEGVKFFKFSNGPIVFENRTPPETLIGHGFCLVKESSHPLEDAEILGETAKKIDRELRK